MSRPSRLDALAQQRDQHRISSDVSRVLREESARLVLEVERLLKAAEKEYQDAAAMHALNKVSHCGGRIAALKDVLKLI